MDNSQDFARAERRSLALKAAVVTPAILAAGLLPGARWGLTGAGGIAVACLALSGAAWLTARPSAFPLRRLAVLLVIEASLAAAGLYALGTLGPAAALPAAFAAHYACLLGPRGAAAAGAAALIALAGAVACGAGPVAGSFALAGPLILSAAAFPAYAARQRDETAARLESTRIGALDEAHARRVLSGLRTVASADTESHTARALAAALSAVTGYPAAAVFLRAFGSEELVFAAADMGEREAILAGAAPEPIDAHTPAALAVRGGASVPLGSTDGAAPLPAWARERGFTSGIAAPIATGAETLGAAYVLRKQPAQPLLADLERTEAFLGIAAPFLANTRRRSIGRPQTDRLSRALAEAGRASRIPSREPLTVSNLRLDPTTERISIDNVVVSLSKTEFALLHSLAENPGAVVEPTALISAAWDGSALPASNAVDVAVHRLRRKLARAPGGDNLVRTVRGKGYMLVPPSPR